MYPINAIRLQPIGIPTKEKTKVNESLPLTHWDMRLIAMFQDPDSPIFCEKIGAVFSHPIFGGLKSRMHPFQGCNASEDPATASYGTPCWVWPNRSGTRPKVPQSFPKKVHRGSFESHVWFGKFTRSGSEGFYRTAESKLCDNDFVMENVWRSVASVPGTWRRRQCFKQRDEKWWADVEANVGPDEDAEDIIMKSRMLQPSRQGPYAYNCAEMQKNPECIPERIIKRRVWRYGFRKWANTQHGEVADTPANLFTQCSPNVAYRYSLWPSMHMDPSDPAKCDLKVLHECPVMARAYQEHLRLARTGDVVTLKQHYC